MVKITSKIKIIYIPPIYQNNKDKYNAVFLFIPGAMEKRKTWNTLIKDIPKWDTSLHQWIIKVIQRYSWFKCF